MNDPIQRIRPIVKGERLTAERLNQAGLAINRQNTGVRAPTQKRATRITGGLPYEVRFALTDDSVPLRGTPEIDGSTDVREGDHVLVSFDTDVDGVYEVRPGPWIRIGKINAQHGTDKAPVYKMGKLISVWGGSSGPLVFQIRREDVSEV